MAELAHITRRGILKGIATSSVVAVPSVAAASSELAHEPEHPWETARRLAHELSDVLRATDDGRWFATIYPADQHEYPIMFGDIKSQEDARNYVDTRLSALIGAHREAVEIFSSACDATDRIAIGREPSKAAWRRYTKASRDEEKSFLAVCEFRPMNDATRSVKAKYLQEFTRHTQLNEVQVAALLSSMLSRITSLMR
ncbi:hypothetical protein [Pararhizobium gei]|uniref:hypothetical protein n=1 Tax=Pararhizobium gei TaxID=1395951 RepID=UPI0023DBFB42|nr:hypothetical protein [Rhizobium gei]